LAEYNLQLTAPEYKLAVKAPVQNTKPVKS